MRYTGTTEAARALGTDPSRVRRLAEQGRIPGAHKAGRDWMIPDPPKVKPARKGPAMKTERVLASVEAADSSWWAYGHGIIPQHYALHGSPPAEVTALAVPAPTEGCPCVADGSGLVLPAEVMDKLPAGTRREYESHRRREQTFHEAG